MKELEDWFEQEAEKQQGMKPNLEIIIDDEIKSRLWKLNDLEYSELEKSILKEGCREPLVVWNNILIDGHNRLEICKRYGIEYKKRQVQFESKSEALKWIDHNQLGRRNITDEQRTVLIGRITKTLKKDLGNPNFKNTNQGGVAQIGQNVRIGKSQDELSKELKVSIKTLQRSEKYLDAIEEIERTCGKKIVDDIITGILKISIQDTIQIAELDPFEQEKVINEIKEKPNNNLKKITKEIKKKELSEKGKYIQLKTIDIRLGDFSKVLDDIPDNSIDMILTDPPYPYEYINEWSKLGEFANKKLKDGGFLIAYSGHIHLPEVINRVLQSGLKWYWIGACLHTGAGLAQVFEVNMFAKFKPILFFYKGTKHKQENWTSDVFESNNSETKDFHIWGQTIDIFDKIIKTFEPTYVVDPFLGGGTTAIACLMNDIKFIGAEIDEQSYNISKKRIDDYENDNR